MTTAVAPPPVSAPLGPQTSEPAGSSRTYAAIAPSNPNVTTPNSKSSASNRPGGSNGSPPSHDGSAQREKESVESKRSPNSLRGPGSGGPKVVVKKEPHSPEIPTPRHRPRRLDLSNSTPTTGGALSARPSAGQLTSKESAGLAMHDIGLACLSPGFHTQDAAMREQLQRSVDVQKRQRQIIEARQKGTKVQQEGSNAPPDSAFRGPGKPPGSSRRKGPPPALSINAPSHHQFANERVIQSAPLNQSFTGLRGHQMHPMARQVVNQPSSLSQTSHIHHVPANQTNNRLPPIADVFAGESLGTGRYNGGNSHSDGNNSNGSPGHSSHSNRQPPLPSPSFPPSSAHQHGGPSQPPPTSRPREYKSAEEAVQSLSGGREDLLPRIVHYGGHQPPTPPSPMPPKGQSHAHPSSAAHTHTHAHAHPSSHPHQELHHHRSTGDIHAAAAAAAAPAPALSAVPAGGSSRRRGRDEYERDMGTPPLGRQERRSGPFGEGRDSPETQRRKKEEFMGLCARAWDLFHS